MLYRLEIENFYCIRDRQILDLTVPRTTPDNPERFAPIFKGSDLRAPKVVTVYGANGSGKSTVLKAIALVRWIISDSFQVNGKALPCEPFNDEESFSRPIRIAIEFGGLAELSKAAQTRNAEGQDVPHGVYRYELELGTRQGNVTTIDEEILRYKRNGRGKWLRVFERIAGKKLLGSKFFPLSGYTKVIDKIRDNASAVATLALFEHEPSLFLVAAANKILTNIFLDKTEPSYDYIVEFFSGQPDIVTALNKEIQKIDVGIEEMQIDQTANGPQLFFRHEGLHVKMPWALESNGTQSFIGMFPLLLGSLYMGGIAIIDELDISIHPLILPEIIRWYYDPERNPRGAQLWMTCHSVSLMDELTKEEIVLCEKDRQGRSSIYSLMDVKGTLRGDNLYKKYLSGVYGAVPHIG